MKISSAVFTVSSPNWRKCPQDGRPEYAFIGRSNVGKSSLINMLTGVKGLAKTSGRPGKTQLINHFLINNEWYLVDLPGYGYARTSKSSRDAWGTMMRDYFLHREELTNTYVLVDSRLKPQRIDLDFIAFLGQNGVPLTVVFTKTDKEKQRDVGGAAADAAHLVGHRLRTRRTARPDRNYKPKSERIDEKDTARSPAALTHYACRRPRRGAGHGRP